MVVSGHYRRYGFGGGGAQMSDQKCPFAAIVGKEITITYQPSKETLDVLRNIVEQLKAIAWELSDKSGRDY